MVQPANWTDLGARIRGHLALAKIALSLAGPKDGAQHGRGGRKGPTGRVGWPGLAGGKRQEESIAK